MKTLYILHLCGYDYGIYEDGHMAFSHFTHDETVKFLEILEDNGNNGMVRLLSNYDMEDFIIWDNLIKLNRSLEHKESY